MKKYIFKDHCGTETKEIIGWDYKMLPSGSYMVYNSTFYDRNPVMDCKRWYLAKVEAI